MLGKSFLITALLVALGPACVGDGIPPALDADDGHTIGLALRAIKMTPSDLSFKKDYVESELVLQKARQFLHQPLALPEYAGLVATNLIAAASIDALAVFSHNQLEIQMPRLSFVSPKIQLDPAFTQQLPPAVMRGVERLISAASAASVLLQRAFPEDKSSAFAAFAVDALNLQRDSEELDSWDKLSVPTEKARQLLKRDENLELQDDELADAILSAADKLDRPALFWALRILARAVDEVVTDLRTNALPQEFQAYTETPLGTIVCGGSGKNVYTNETLLIIDTGGDDVYENSAGGANGLAGRPISIVIDLAGNDQYVSRRSFSQGSAVFGIGILVDCAGDDVYEAKHLSQGAGFFGCGVLADYGGQDKFEADTFCQGAGEFGAGILWQRAGDSSYKAAQLAQGFGGPSGLGLLLDENGSDLYFAGGRYPCHWLPGHNFSLSQGFGYGMRPFAGGGVGILCDFTGDDRYNADVYGQGASYWYATGLLLDAAGNDSYTAYQYCQGAGIHLTSGALIDWRGDDSYTAHAICQGGAHDYSVGMLIDRAGNDRYHADTTAQGSAINNSFGLLLDRTGDDTYTGTDPKQSQAAGHDGGKREYGSIALLLDLAGTDVYSQTHSNDMVWLKPWYGAGLDTNVLAGSVAALQSQLSLSATPTNASSPRRLYRKDHVDPHHPVERLLRRAVREPNTEERRNDADAAWNELKKRGTEALPYLLTRVDSPVVLIRAKVEDLIDFLGTNSIPSLIAGIDGAKNDEVARLCCYFLARFDEKAAAATPHVLPLIKRDKTRATAFYTLGHLKAQEAFEPALAALADERELVRLRAAQALGRIGDERAIPKLIAVLDDEMWDVRYAAQNALVALDKPSIEPLRQAFAKAPARSKLHIVEALAQLGDREAKKWAEEALRNEDPLVRSAIEKALAKKLESPRE